MSNLIRYDAAVKAIAECRAVDEVKDWHDKSAAMQAYGRMAKDKVMELDAAEIRIRAERKLGELIAQQKAGDGLAKPGPRSVASNDRSSVPKLSDSGISKDMSSRAQKLAAVPEDEFEAALAEKREIQQREGERVTARLVKRGEEIRQASEAIPDDDGPDEAEIAALRAMEESDRRTIDLLMASDDKFAALMQENKRLNAELAVVKGQRDRYMNQANEFARQVKALKREAKRAA